MFSFWCNMFWNGLILWACMVSCNGMFDTASPVNLFHCFTCVITLCHANDDNTTWVAKNTYQFSLHVHHSGLVFLHITPYIRSCVLNWHGSSHTHKYMSTYAAWRHEHQLVKQSANYVIKCWRCYCRQAAAHQLLGTTRPSRSGAMVKGYWRAVIGYCL